MARWVVQDLLGDPMARLGRYFPPEQPLQVIQRGNNRAAKIVAEEDYARYRDCSPRQRPTMAAP